MSLMIDETRLNFHRYAAAKFCFLDAFLFNGQKVNGVLMVRCAFR